RNCAGQSRMTRIGVSAVTVAVRGPWSMSAISPKKAARAERSQRLAVSLHTGGAAHDDEEIAARAALGAEDLARGDARVLDPRSDEAELCVVAAAEERDRSEQLAARILRHDVGGLGARARRRNDQRTRRHGD